MIDTILGADKRFARNAELRAGIQLRCVPLSTSWVPVRCNAESCGRATIRWVIDAIVYPHRPKVEGIHAHQAPYVEAVLIWAASPLMVSIYATNGTEEVSGSTRIELMELQHIMSFDNRQSRQWH